MTVFESTEAYLARGGAITICLPGQRGVPIDTRDDETDGDDVEPEDDPVWMASRTPCGFGYQRARCRGAQ